MSRAWLVAVTQLTVLLTCCGLATSRLGLVVHELVGHGGTALAVGGEVTDVWLFYFAGGWIRYRTPGGELAIALGGIVVEAVIGAALILLARQDRLGSRIVRAIGCALVIHAAWYLATGTWYGFGDGLRLHRALGDRAWLVAVPAGVIACAAAYVGARTVLGSLASSIPGGHRARIGGTLVAVVVAGGLQLGAALGEVVLRRDTAYANVMRPERERVIARELATWTAEQQRTGRVPTAEAREKMQAALEQKHRPFPFGYLLGACTLVAILVGAFRSRPIVHKTLSPRMLAVVTGVAAGSIALVIAIDAGFH
ncbi:MAG: hypothetical protein SFX73_05345 [Kofleriaceae bacterium]|nr:hypothetical protein [Kofleriaceae bacterium]